jgi:hypothetical protein
VIDDTEGTAWGNTRTSSAQDQTGSVTVALSPTPDTANTLISTIRLGAFPGIGLPRFGAVKNYTIEVSDDGTTWTTAATGTVKTDPPRPVSPELNYPTITLATPVRATSSAWTSTIHKARSPSCPSVTSGYSPEPRNAGPVAPGRGWHSTVGCQPRTGRGGQSGP